MHVKIGIDTIQVSPFAVNNYFVSKFVIIWTFLACLLSALGLIILSFLPSSEKVWSVMMFVIIGFAYGASAGGPGVNQIDLSPRFAGIVMAVTNTCSATFSVVGPLVVQVIVTDEVSITVIGNIGIDIRE